MFFTKLKDKRAKEKRKQYLETLCAIAFFTSESKLLFNKIKKEQITAEMAIEIYKLRYIRILKKMAKIKPFIFGRKKYNEDISKINTEYETQITKFEELLNNKKQKAPG